MIINLALEHRRTEIYVRYFVMNRSLWVLVLCAGTILGLSVGFRQVLGLFLTPMTTDLSLGRESFAFAMGLMNLFWGLGAPIAGAIADKYGASRVAILGGAVYALGLLRVRPESSCV
ncbi:MAG: MFS family permease [Alphaproteobacteria bacterium]